MSHLDARTGEEALLAEGSSPAVCVFPVGEAMADYCPASCSGASGCPEGGSEYLMTMHDAGYNGWGSIGYVVHKHDAGNVGGQEVGSGTLAAGHMAPLAASGSRARGKRFEVPVEKPCRTCVESTC